MRPYIPNNGISRSVAEPIVPLDYDYLGNSASATDCTGLIPAGTIDEADLMRYQDLVHFGGMPMPPRDLYLAGYPQPPK